MALRLKPGQSLSDVLIKDEPNFSIHFLRARELTRDEAIFLLHNNPKMKQQCANQLRAAADELYEAAKLIEKEIDKNGD